VLCDSVEDEVHVLLDCSAYTEIRANLLSIIAFCLIRLWFEYQPKPVLIVYIFGTITYIGVFVYLYIFYDAVL